MIQQQRRRRWGRRNTKCADLPGGKLRGGGGTWRKLTSSEDTCKGGRQREEWDSGFSGQGAREADDDRAAHATMQRLSAAISTNLSSDESIKLFIPVSLQDQYGKIVRKLNEALRSKKINIKWHKPPGVPIEQLGEAEINVMGRVEQ